ADLNLVAVLVAVFEKPRSQRLTHDARANHANFHVVFLRQVQPHCASAAPANSRGTGQGSPQGRSSRFDPQTLESWRRTERRAPSPCRTTRPATLAATGLRSICS